MSLLSDKQIVDYVESYGMIQPFLREKVRESYGTPILSKGLSSFSYDISLSPKSFRIFTHIPGEIVDPKNFNSDFLGDAKLHSDSTGSYFILPGHTYALGIAVEYLDIPENITVVCVGKSTYARCGIICNTTPGEAGWKGYLTLEFSNSSPSDCKIYVNEGVAALLFLKGDSKCLTPYGEGKYQDQSHEVVTARI